MRNEWQENPRISTTISSRQQQRRRRRQQISFECFSQINWWMKVNWFSVLRLWNELRLNIACVCVWANLRQTQLKDLIWPVSNCPEIRCKVVLLVICKQTNASASEPRASNVTHWDCQRFVCANCELRKVDCLCVSACVWLSFRISIRTTKESAIFKCRKKREKLKRKITREKHAANNTNNSSSSSSSSGKT